MMARFMKAEVVNVVRMLVPNGMAKAWASVTRAILINS